MLESFYGLTDNPFRMSADAHFRYAHRSYKKAWSYLKYALEQGEGFVLITGRPGTGKTTLILDILSELDNERIQPVNLVTNQLQGEELLRLVALEFGFQAQEFNKATLLTRIEQHALLLHQQGQRILVIVDEAQNLSTNGLEELRLLSNLQSGSQSLFQIVLIGQEELRSLIYGQGIENIKQRILVSCRLEPMQDQHIEGYVAHRLGIVGWTDDPRFEAEIFPLLYRMTQGVPREINLVMARLLLYGALETKHVLGVSDLLVVLHELDQEQRLAFDKTAVLAELNESSKAAETTADSTPSDAPETVSGAGQPVSSQALPAEEMEGPSDQPEKDSEATVEPALSEPEATEWADEPLQEDKGPEKDATHAGDLTEQEIGQPDTEIQAIPTPPEKAADQDDTQVSGPFEPLWTDVTDPESDTQRTDWEVPSEPTTSAIETETDALPSLRATRDDDHRPQGLLTDVDDLLENGDGFGKRLRLAWRWLFYPLAILLLLLAILMPKPGDLSGLWHQLKQSLDALVEPPPGDSPHAGKAANVSQEGSVERPGLEDMEGGEGEGRSPTGAGDPALEQPLVQGDPAKSSTGFIRPDAVEGRDALSIDADKDYWLALDPTSGEMGRESQTLYDQLVDWLSANPAAVLVLTGVSTNGSDPLAQMRDALEQAERVSRLFLRAGIPAQRIAIESSGTGVGSVRTGVHVELKPSGFSTLDD